MTTRLLVGLVGLVGLLVVPALAADKFQIVSESPLGNGMEGLYSTDLKQVAFGAPSKIIIRSLDTGQEKQIQLSGRLGFLLAWSPDGRFIYHLRQSQGSPYFTNDLWRCDVRTGTSEHILPHVGWSPALSPDGAQLAFPRGTSLMLSSSDGKSVRKLCEGCGSSRVVWSPDSASLAVYTIRNGSDHPTLTLVSVATGAVTNLAALPPGGLDSFLWPSGAGGVFFNFFRNSDQRRYRVTVWTDASYTWQDSQIWFCAIPGGTGGELYQVTHASPGYTGLFAGAPDGMTLIARRNTPMPGYWELMENLFGAVRRHESGAIVQLRLKK
jgi:hypothetical protein